MTDAGQKRLVELCEEYQCTITYYRLSQYRWWCIGHAPRGRLLARWPIIELEFDNSIYCTECGARLNDAPMAYSEVF